MASMRVSRPKDTFGSTALLSSARYGRLLLVSAICVSIMLRIRCSSASVMQTLLIVEKLETIDLYLLLTLVYNMSIHIMNGPKSKYQTIYDDIKSRISSGEYLPGAQLPTEVELVKHYEVSRPTVNKALSMLQHHGLIRRRSGAGSFVSAPQDRPYTAEKLSDNGQPGTAIDHTYFGLLIPMLGVTEIFEPICARIAQQSHAHNFHVLWGDSAAHSGSNIAADFERTCMRYIDRGLDGIFFVPLELTPESEVTNARIVARLRDAHIPVVMLDADYLRFPERSEFDLVGIDNVRAGYLAAQHYLEQGAKRVDYLQKPYSACTVTLRERGFRMALEDAGIASQPEYFHTGDPSDREFVADLLQKGATEIVCANDVTAAEFMLTADSLATKVPSDIRVLGFDDVKYARFARIPLTTFRQPCAELGDLAVETMLSRIREPDRPPITVSAQADLIVRHSSLMPPHKGALEQ
ncbi:MAG: GntR family transcriptional regulator [Spirochaetaceae bacterium]|nr:MAG: GntR family transcriptional regulator [Spirochaetaceae bacterium]